MLCASSINTGHTVVAIHKFTVPLTKKSLWIQPCPEAYQISLLISNLGLVFIKTYILMLSMRSSNLARITDV